MEKPDSHPASPAKIDSQPPPKESWVKNDVQDIVKNRVWIVMGALMLSAFCAITDQTIVAVAATVILKELNASSGYSWIGTSFLVTGAAFTPLYGKSFELIGQKPTILGLIAIFAIGSALCGAAQNYTWLCIARGIQGAGGGGIMTAVMTIGSTLFPLEKRGLVQGVVGLVMSTSLLAGPLIGAAFAQSGNWRWIFYFNLPTLGVSATILFFTFNGKPRTDKTVGQHVREMDWVSLFSVAAGTALLLVGFDSAQSDWGSAETIATLAVGVACYVAAALNIAFLLPDSRTPLFPRRLFKARTPFLLLIAALCQGIIFVGAIYYLPVYYQGLGHSAVNAALRVLPFTVVSAIGSISSGILLMKIQSYKPILIGGSCLTTLGFSLTAGLFDYDTSVGAQIVVQIITGLGVGSTMQTMLIGLQASMPFKDINMTTAAFALIRLVAGSIGISVGATAFATTFSHRASDIAGYSEPSSGVLGDAIYTLTAVRPDALRDQVLHAFAIALRSNWILFASLAGTMFICFNGLKKYELKRKVVTTDTRKPAADIEQAPVSSPATTSAPIAPSPSASEKDVQLTASR